MCTCHLHGHTAKLLHLPWFRRSTWSFGVLDWVTTIIFFLYMIQKSRGHCFHMLFTLHTVAFSHKEIAMLNMFRLKAM